MPIPVTCPSCLTRFSVSDKFAGKSGPCPKCKSTIKIPELSEQVVIHAPVDSAPKDSKGRSIFKPIRRQEVQLGLPVILTAVLGSIVLMSVALGLRINSIQAPALLLGFSAPLLAFPIVTAGYWFLRDDELEGYGGRELLIRCGICSIVFAFGWGLYKFIPAFVGGHASTAETSAIEMVILFLIMIGLGTAAAVLALELEVTQGLLLYMLYFLITFALVWVSGTPLSEALPGQASTRESPTTNSSPTDLNIQTQGDSQKPNDTRTTSEPSDSEPPRDIPNLLQ